MLELWIDSKIFNQKEKKKERERQGKGQ